MAADTLLQLLRNPHAFSFGVWLLLVCTMITRKYSSQNESLASGGDGIVGVAHPPPSLVAHTIDFMVQCHLQSVHRSMHAVRTKPILLSTSKKVFVSFLVVRQRSAGQ